MGSRSDSDDSGYIMVALLVGIAIAAVWMSAALPSWRQQAMREKEAELIFRGEQYARAIWLYQQKMNGALPSSFEDLISQHVLRKKWKDPITGEEFLPKVGCLTGMPGGGAGGVMPPGMGGIGGGGVGGPAGQRGITPGGRGPTSTMPPVQSPVGRGNPGQVPIQPGGRGPTVPGGQMPGGQMPGGQMPGGQMPGGFGGSVGGGICGVQSKSKAASIKVYLGQQEYDLWQFDTLVAAQRFQQSVARLGGGVGVPGIGVPMPGMGGVGGVGPFGPGGQRGIGGRGGPGGVGGPRGVGPGGIGPFPPGQGGGPGRGSQPPVFPGGGGRGRE